MQSSLFRWSSIKLLRRPPSVVVVALDVLVGLEPCKLLSLALDGVVVGVSVVVVGATASSWCLELLSRSDSMSSLDSCLPLSCLLVAALDVVVGLEPPEVLLSRHSMWLLGSVLQL